MSDHRSAFNCQPLHLYRTSWEAAVYIHGDSSALKAHTTFTNSRNRGIFRVSSSKWKFDIPKKPTKPGDMSVKRFMDQKGTSRPYCNVWEIGRASCRERV